MSLTKSLINCLTRWLLNFIIIYHGNFLNDVFLYSAISFMLAANFKTAELETFNSYVDFLMSSLNFFNANCMLEGIKVSAISFPMMI